MDNQRSNTSSKRDDSPSPDTGAARDFGACFRFEQLPAAHAAAANSRRLAASRLRMAPR